MKNLTKKLFASSILMSTVFASTAMAAQKCENNMVESYAHPTMFNSQVLETATDDATFVTGAKCIKTSPNKVNVLSKENVLVETWAKNVLNIIKENQTYTSDFNCKLPVLRSELAVILAEGFNLGTSNCSSCSKYSDVPSSYWAKDWICRALSSGVMIGYPDNSFKPDQYVTKAEVFATIAQLINVPYNSSTLISFNGKSIEYIPQWALNATREVVNSNLLKGLPDTNKVNTNEYLSKEQVAYLVGALRQNWATSNSIAKDKNAPCGIKNYNPTCLKIKITDRLSARTSNVGEKFTAVTTNCINIGGQNFAEGSKVKGQVIEVSRPGVGCSGYIKVKFLNIKDENGNCANFPEILSKAQVDCLKNPNFVSRLLGAPFSAAGRVAGVAGRTAASGANVVANTVEQFGGNVSDTFVDLAALQPTASVKKLGNGFLSLGMGVVNVVKLAVSGTFGVVYEFTDEIRYLIVPSYSNDSSINPNEEMTIIF